MATGAVHEGPKPPEVTCRSRRRPSGWAYTARGWRPRAGMSTRRGAQRCVQWSRTRHRRRGNSIPSGGACPWTRPDWPRPAGALDDASRPRRGRLPGAGAVARAEADRPRRAWPAARGPVFACSAADRDFNSSARIAEREAMTGMFRDLHLHDAHEAHRRGHEGRDGRALQRDQRAGRAGAQGDAARQHADLCGRSMQAGEALTTRNRRRPPILANMKSSTMPPVSFSSRP